MEREWLDCDGYDDGKDCACEQFTDRNESGFRVLCPDCIKKMKYFAIIKELEHIRALTFQYKSEEDCWKDVQTYISKRLYELLNQVKVNE